MKALERIASNMTRSGPSEESYTCSVNSSLAPSWLFRFRDFHFLSPHREPFISIVPARLLGKKLPSLAIRAAERRLLYRRAIFKTVIYNVQHSSAT